MRHFKIDLGPSGLIQDDPISFSVTGSIDGEAWEQTFECLPALPVGTLAALGGWTFPASQGVEFVAGCLTQESEDRWRLLVRDKQRVVTDVDLANIVRNLLVQYTGRPQTPSTESPNGAATIGTTSTDG